MTDSITTTDLDEMMQIMDMDPATKSETTGFDVYAGFTITTIQVPVEQAEAAKMASRLFGQLTWTFDDFSDCLRAHIDHGQTIVIRAEGRATLTTSHG